MREECRRVLYKCPWGRGGGGGGRGEVCVYRGSNLQVYIHSASSFACSATSPSFAYVSNPAPDNFLCRDAAPRLRPLQLLLPNCVCFNYSPIVSASAAAPRLCPLQLLLPIVQLLLPDCMHRLAAPAVLEDSSHARAQCSQTFFAEFEVE